MIATLPGTFCTCTATVCTCYQQRLYYETWPQVNESLYELYETDFDLNRPASALKPRPWVRVRQELPRYERDRRPQSRGPGAHRRACY